jgi:hypothetical protein
MNTILLICILIFSMSITTIGIFITLNEYKKMNILFSEEYYKKLPKENKIIGPIVTSIGLISILIMFYLTMTKPIVVVEPYEEFGFKFY